MWSALARWFDTTATDATDFDHAFYAALYPDLLRLDTPAKLRAHFTRHGRAEGRFRNLGEARAYHAQRGRRLPTGFDPDLYRILNPDLHRLFTEPWQYELHFLEHGLAEGRPHRRRQPSRLDWTAIFDVHDFLLFSAPWRSPGPLRRAEALALFEQEGVARLTPIARGWSFDPAFYAAHYGLDGLGDAALYSHWLETGLAKGFAPNETRALAPYLDGRPYPACFDWRRLLGLGRDHPPHPAKIDALRQLFHRPLDQHARGCVRGTDAADLYVAIGEFHLMRGVAHEAIAAFDEALTFATAAPQIHLRRGEALDQIGQRAAALQDFSLAAGFPGASVWALVYAARLATEQGRHDDAFAWLAAGRERWAGRSEFRRAVDDCVATRFRQIAQAVGDALDDGADDAGETAQQALDALTVTIQTLKLRAGYVTPLPSDRVVMLACLDLPQCKRYRVDQKREQLATQGIGLDVFASHDVEGFLRALPGASAALFYRIASNPKTIEAMLTARAMGLTTYYDIDDLIFSPVFPDTLDSYGGEITRAVHDGLRRDVVFVRHAISLCDYGMTSTRALAREVEPLVRYKSFHVVANGLDTASALAIQLGAHPKPPGARVTIFYGSGTKAHHEDFDRVAAPALLHLLEHRPGLHLCVAGYLTLSPAFDRFGARIVRLPFLSDLDQYWALLSTCDINLSVLKSGPIADCKSEIKWLEAAALAIPSVVSRTATFAEVIEDGVDGQLAVTTGDWVAALSALIDNPEARQTMGRAARRKALRAYAGDRLGAHLAAILRTGDALADLRLRKTARGRGRRKTRLLLCNVFFAPQTYGGATRVVEDNVASLLKRHADAFDLFIVATEEGAPPGYFRVDVAKGCTVFRIGTPLEAGMNWRPFNPDNAASYNRVLDLVAPDIVHFHCIQRLTATIVEETAKRSIPYLVTLHDAWWICDHQFLVDPDGTVVAPAPADLFSPPTTGIDPARSVERAQRLRALLSSAARALPVSDRFAALHRRAGIDNLTVVANGLPTLPPPHPPRTRADRLVLGHIGGRSAHKGASLVEVALRENAFDRLELIMADATLEIGEERHLLWGATPVTLRGYVPQHRVNELFATFDVLLAPSIWPESFGLVTREAAFYGKWIVASDRGAIGDDVVEGRNGWRIDVGDTRALVGVLAQMNAAPGHYTIPPLEVACVRTADDQADDLAVLYEAVLTDQASDAARDAGRVDSLALG